MTENTDSQAADASNHDGSPPLPAGDRNFREKGGRKGGKWILIGFGLMLLVATFVMFTGGRNSGTPTPQQNRADQVGGAEVESKVLDGFRTVEDGDTNVGQERAEVLREIDDREELQARIERGESAVQFGDAFDEEEEVVEPEPSKPAPVFGNLTPRDPDATIIPSGRPSPQVTPTANTGNGGGINPEGVAHELALLQAGRRQGGNTAIHYTSYEPTPTPSPQAISRTTNDDDPAIKAGQWAMPGDLTTAYMANRVSSDQPSGMVTADILDGELRGGRLLGSGSVEGMRILIYFTQLVFEGEIYEVSALAVDPQTLDSSVQDGINRRLFTRYGVPILMGVASIGIDYQAEQNNPSVTERNLSTGDVVSRRTNDSTSFGDYALGESTDAFKRPFEDIASNAAATQPEVWAEPGVIGVMFQTPVPTQ
jgi:hypothetical protein